MSVDVLNGPTLIVVRTDVSRNPLIWFAGVRFGIGLFTLKPGSGEGVVFASDALEAMINRALEAGAVNADEADYLRGRLSEPKRHGLPDTVESLFATIAAESNGGECAGLRFQVCDCPLGILHGCLFDDDHHGAVTKPVFTQVQLLRILEEMIGYERITDQQGANLLAQAARLPVTDFVVERAVAYIDGAIIGGRGPYHPPVSNDDLQALERGRIGLVELIVCVRSGQVPPVPSSAAARDSRCPQE